MCMAAVALIGSVISGVGAKREMDQQAANLETQANLDRRQAAINQTTGAYKADRKREEVERVLGSQRAAYSGSGVSLTGTAAEVIEDSATEGELDVQAIRWSTGMESEGKRAEARAKDVSAKNTRKAGNIAFLTPVLEGVAKFGSSFGY